MPKKVVSKSRLRRLKIQQATMCFDCQRKAGGAFPSGSCVTVTEDFCPCCGEKKSLVPACDFNWDDGRKAIFD